jgi:hypothetical protein
MRIVEPDRGTMPHDQDIQATSSELEALPTKQLKHQQVDHQVSS